MRIAIRDTTDSHTVGFFDNKAGIKFKSAEMTQFLKGACSYVSIKYRSKDVEKVRAGCKLAFRHKGKDYWLTINEFNKQGTEVEITAYSLSLEANKEKRGAYKASSAMSIVDYFSVFDPEKSLEIGINEVSDKKLTLEWTGTDTVLARLYSIANSFDAELEFVTELNPNYSLKRHVVNIYRSGNLGGDSTGRPVRVGTELKVLGFNSNINDLYTAIDVTGKDGLKLPDKTIKDAKGEVQFFSKNGRLYAPQARDKFPSNNVNVNDGYILAEAKSTEYTDQEALFGYALSEMKKHCDVQVEYSTEGAVKGSVGDTKTLIDSINFKPALYVQARITEQTEDLETGKSLKTTFSNFKRTSSQLSKDLTKKIEELAKSAVPYRIVMVTSNGTSFKNGTGESIVNPKLFKGDAEITDATYRFNFNNNTVAGLNYTVNASAVSGTSVLKIDAYVGNDVVASDELTFINVNDGLNGSKGADGNGIASSVVTYQAGTSATVAPTGTWSSSPVSVPAGQYLWTRTIFTYTDTTTKTIYSVSRQGVDGANGKDGIAGKDGVGISSTVITYGLSANETTQPTTWTANPPTLVKGQYLWTKTVWTYTDAKTETGYTKTYIAKDGNNGSDGIAGKDGVGIKTTSITYQASTSGTTVPTGTWASQVPSVPNGQFLWTRTIWNYTDSTSETGYSVAKMGTDGINGKDGTSSYTHVAYANKSTNIFLDSFTNFKSYGGYQGSVITSTLNNGAWDVTASGGTHPMKHIFSFNGTTGKTLWYYIKIKNTHATNPLRIVFNGIDKTGASSFPTVTVNPGQTYVKFEQGICRTGYDFIQINIDAVTDDKDIAYTIYDLALYNEQPFINLDFVNGSNKAYMGLYIDEIIQSSTDASKYAWALIKGQKGDQGVPGTPGSDGKTPYWHVAYANNATGTLDFSLSDSSGRKFRGEYVDYVLADSTDPTKYKWLDMTANVKAGNNNLLLDTKSLSRHYWTANNTSETYLGGTVATAKAPSGSYQDTFRQAMKIAPEGNEFIVSFYAKSAIDNVTINNHFYSPNRTIKGISSTGALFNNVNGGDGLIALKLTTQWKRYWIKWTIRDASSEAENVPMNVILGRNFDSVNSVSIALPALYAGNLNTEHSDAPEDTQLKIDSKADSELTQDQLNLLLETQNLMTAELKAKATAEQVDALIASYNKYVSDESVNKANVEAELIANAERIEAFRKDYDEKMLQLDFVNNYMRATDLGLEISASDGSSSLLVQKDRISMFSAGKEVMYISQGLIHIDNGVFTKTLQIGNFRESQADGDATTNVTIYVG